MSEFNPSVGEVQPPNYTNRSPAIGPNRAFEALFSGIGDAITGAATTGDTYVKNKIEDDARYGFDQINNDTGVSVESTSNVPGQIKPPELTQSEEGLSKLAAAMNQGKITPEYYHQRLAAQAKNLRAKYPGYEKEVDDIIMNVTGERPANAYRDQLFQNLNSYNNALASSKNQFTKWANEGDNAGLIVTNYPDFYTNPEKYQDPSVQAKVQTDIETQKGQLTVTKNSAALQSADKEVRKGGLSEHIRNLATPFLAGSVNGVDTQSTSAEFQKALADGVISEDERVGLNQYITTMKVRASEEINNQLNKTNTRAGFTQPEINEMINAELTPLTQMMELVNAGNLSEATNVANNLKLRTDKAANQMLQQYPEMATVAALKTFAGDDSASIEAQRIINDAGGGLKFNQKVMSQNAAKLILQGQWDNSQTVQNLTQMKDTSWEEREKMIGAAIQAPLDVIASGKAPADVVAKYTKQNYSDNIDTLFNAVDASTVDGASQRLRLYQKMFDPKITKAIKDSGDAQAMKLYMDAAFDKAQSIPEFKVAAKELSAAGENVNWSKFVKVEYDPEANRMRVFVDQVNMNKADLANSSDLMASDVLQKNQININRLKGAVKSYNTVLNSMSPILEATGKDELQSVKDFTRSLSVNISGGDESGFFKYVADSAQSKATENSKESKDSKGTDLGTDIESTDDPIEWDDGDSEDIIQGVMDKAVPGEGALEKTNYAAEADNTPEAVKAFDAGDLTTSNKRGYTPDLKGLKTEFKTAVSSLQKEFGSPLQIVSGYRDPARNAKAGGAKKSRHMHGDAIDIDVSGMSREERIRLIKLAREQGFGGIGVYPNSLHIDKGRTRSWGPSFRNKSLPDWARAVL